MSLKFRLNTVAAIKVRSNAIGSWVYGPNSTATLYDTGEFIIRGYGPERSRGGSWESPAWNNYIPQIIKIIYDDRITEIGNNTFWNGQNITSIIFPGNLKSIGECAFYKCSKLNFERLPNTITNIGVNAFAYCNNLALSELPNKISSISKFSFFNCAKLRLSSLPSELKTIGEYSFSGCGSLELSYLPKTLENIGYRAFYGCKLNNGELPLIIPNSIKIIASDAFFLIPVSNLQTIIFEGIPTNLGTSIFGHWSTVYGRDIYVPWSEGEIENSPWGIAAENVHYNYSLDNI